MPVLLQRIWIQLTADRKRFGVLCAMLAMGLLLWSRIILVSKVPRTAVADEIAATAPPGARPGASPAQGAGPTRPTGATAPGGGGSPAKTGKSGSARTARSAAPSMLTPSRATGDATAGKSLPVIVVKLDDRPSRDPFQINTHFFPKPYSFTAGEKDAGKSPTQSSEDSGATRGGRSSGDPRGFGGSGLTAPGGAPGDGQDPERQRLAALVNQLQLEAVMQGTPVAIISGRTCRLNDSLVLPGEPELEFRLVEVAARSVVLEARGHRFTLRLTPRLEHR